MYYTCTTSVQKKVLVYVIRSKNPNATLLVERSLVPGRGRLTCDGRGDLVTERGGRVWLGSRVEIAVAQCLVEVTS